jgi:transcription antitermination factor NusG
MNDLIFDVKVPLETVVEIKDNTRKEVERKLFPGYVLVKMILTDESCMCANTRGVTGFVGPASKPVPLSDKEVAALALKTGNSHSVFRRRYRKVIEGPPRRIHRAFGGKYSPKKPCKNRRIYVWPRNAGRTGIEIRSNQSRIIICAALSKAVRIKLEGAKRSAKYHIY